MENIIQYFLNDSIKNIDKLQDLFFRKPEDFASFVYGISDELQKVGLKIIEESLEEMNRIIKESDERKKEWIVEKNTSKQLITALGTIHFKKTLFTNKSTGEMKYLLDQFLQMDPHARMTEDAEARVLEEAVQTSYRRGGEACSTSDDIISKAAVKERLHDLNIPHGWAKPAEKKVVEYLYIEADEDHISLQFNKEKGDLPVNEYGRKSNTLISKLAYVHEGIEREAPQSKRHRLVCPHYFARVCEGRENQAFWDEIYHYICDHYDVDKIKKIYLNADGGSWIKSGMRQIANLTFVLDEFHISKYIIKLTSHMKDSKDDARTELRDVIRHGTKADFNKVVDRLLECLPDETSSKRIEEGRAYFLNNWMPAKIRLLHRDGVVGSSTEGHVSHILLSRMSSRPMGWSKKGASKMTELRAYYKNGGDMLELVRYQRDTLQKAAGGEELVLSASDMLSSERKGMKSNGKYIEKMQHHTSLHIQKVFAIRENLRLI